jgi:predicted MPP superfamily phosphohydrolase
MIGGGMIFLFTLYMFIESKRNRLRKLTLSFKTLPDPFDGYRLFFISDIHKRKISERLLKKLTEDVDYIIIGGDLCEKGVPLKRIEENINRLTNFAPCLFVWGNNDPEVGTDHLKRILNKYQVKELENTKKVIQKGQKQLVLVGIDQLETAMESLREMDLSEDVFSILVCHFPEVVEELPLTHPFRLVLSGHTHGGQIRIFGFGLAKKGGVYKKDNYRLLISNGYGTTGVPFRLGAPAEAHLITLVKE